VKDCEDTNQKLLFDEASYFQLVFFMVLCHSHCQTSEYCQVCYISKTKIIKPNATRNIQINGLCKMQNIE
jgi:hypothetical protein